ncbi:MAG: GNAT family N-acetyltransferase, partial [Clostridium sp.]
YLLDFECFFNEYYLSNIIIKEEFRGKGYSEILIGDVLDTAKEKGYLKVSLRANNEKLVKFYERLGFKRVNSKSKKLIKKI